MSKRFGEQEQKCLTKALHLAWVVVEARLDDEPPDDQEDHAAGKHPEPAQRDDDASRGVAHLSALEISFENCAVGLDKLSDADPDRHQADQHRQPSALGVLEDGRDRLLRRVRRGSARPREDLEPEGDDQRVRQRTRDAAQPLQVTGRVAAAVQGIEAGPDETPQGVGAQADDDQEQNELPQGVADQEDDASGQVEGVALWLRERYPKGEQPDDEVEGASHDVAQSLEKLEPRVGGGALDRVPVRLEGRHLLVGRTAEGPESANASDCAPVTTGAEFTCSMHAVGYKEAKWTAGGLSTRQCARPARATSAGRRSRCGRCAGAARPGGPTAAAPAAATRGSGGPGRRCGPGSRPSPTSARSPSPSTSTRCCPPRRGESPKAASRKSARRA